MADDILELEAVTLTVFAGGTGSRAGLRMRGRCYQITEGATHVELTSREAIDIAVAILKRETHILETTQGK